MSFKTLKISHGQSLYSYLIGIPNIHPELQISGEYILAPSAWTNTLNSCLGQLLEELHHRSKITQLNCCKILLREDMKFKYC